MVPLIHPLVAAALAHLLVQGPVVRPLVPGAIVRDSLAGGGHAVYSIDIPPDTAARVTVKQEGLDVSLLVQRAGSATPEHPLNLVGGLGGDETAYPAIANAAATWNITVNAATARAARGDYTIVVDLSPADDRARAIVSARALHQAAVDAAWPGDGASFGKAMPLYASLADAAAAAGDATIAAEATYQGARLHDLLGDVPGAIELQKRALQMFRALDRRDRESRVLNRLGDLSRKVGEVGDAERYLSDALPLAQSVGDTGTVAEILNNWGLLLVGIWALATGKVVPGKDRDDWRDIARSQAQFFERIANQLEELIRRK